MSNIMALDIGEKRVGVAMASHIARLPHPVKTVLYEQAFSEIDGLIKTESVDTIVVGLPLNRDEAPTKQTEFTQEFIKKLKDHVAVPIETCSEALSSIRAKQELEARGVAYQKGDIDALAATYILDDYLKENPS